MEARLIADRRRWNDFVSQAPTAHICQTYEWAEHQGPETDSKSLRVGVEENGELIAAMLLVYSRATGVSAPFYYVPRGPVSYSRNLPALKMLMEFARREARKRGAFMIRVESNFVQDDPAWQDVFRQLGFRSTNHTIYMRNSWVTDLQPSEDAILANMQTSWRRYIRAGERAGVSIRIGTGEQDFDAFYELMRETAKRDGFYLYPRELFSAMLSIYTPERAAQDGAAEMALFLAEYAGEPIAAATVARLGDWAWYLHGASSSRPEHRKLRPNHVLQWECMRWAKAHGSKFYDWRTIPDRLEPGEELYGVYVFKRGFGGSVRRVLPTQDLILRPAIYWPYVAGVSLRRRIQKWRQTASERRESSHTAERGSPTSEGVEEKSLQPGTL